ncbi:conserved hypothetical protein [Trichinella spiralis]|uniref:hypothetical protein n=1 Tax=Trichinella spiralis TaxID=6334 RepID=UPI0001EFC5D7|nr:conserved hypothetical protein [Trichinella spiralis]
MIRFFFTTPRIRANERADHDHHRQEQQQQHRSEKRTKFIRPVYSDPPPSPFAVADRAYQLQAYLYIHIINDNIRKFTIATDQQYHQVATKPTVKIPLNLQTRPI